jgi:hypothetical protein
MQLIAGLCAIALLLPCLTAQAANFTELSDCHFHGESLFCFAEDGSEWEVTSDFDEGNPPIAYNDCHSHGSDEL